MKQVEVGPQGAQLGYVELEGDGPPLVFLHGLGACSAVYNAQTAVDQALAGRHVLMIDFLGFGISDRPTGFGYTVRDHADSIGRALDALGLSGVDLVGHSMGGAIALVLAMRRPDLVGRLVLAEPSPGPAARPWVDPFTEEAFVDHGFTQTLADAGPAWAATMRLGDAAAFYRSTVSLGRDASLITGDLLRDLAVPCALVEGEQTRGLAIDPSIRASGIPVRIVAGAGHCMMLDNPAGFAQAICEALAALGARSGASRP